MTQYALEVFLPAASPRTTARACRLAALAQDLRGEGMDVHYLSALHLPEDETCFFVFAADSLTTMRTLRARARLAQARLIPVASLDTTKGDPT